MLSCQHALKNNISSSREKMRGKHQGHWDTSMSFAWSIKLQHFSFSTALYFYLVFIFDWLSAFPALSNSSALHPVCSSRTDRLIQQVTTPAEISQQADHNPSRCLQFIGQMRAPQTSEIPAPQMWNLAT